MGKPQLILSHFPEKNRFFIEFLGKSQPKTVKWKNAKRLFRKKAIICRCGGSRPKCLVCRSFFIESLSKKNFRCGGPQKSTILGLFSKIDVRNFCQLGKNVFFVLPIFSKNRGNGGLFWGVRPNFFFHKNLLI